MPDAKIVLAHLGGFHLWEKVLPALPEMDVMLDTSYSLQVREQWDLFAEIIRRNGASKVLFGTDLPWYDPNYCLGSVLYADIADADRDNIFYKNAERIIRSIKK